MNRKYLAEKYLKGSGIEIGALHNPLQVSETVKVLYVDRMDIDGLYTHYPELRQYKLVNVDIIDDGETLNNVKNDSQDFIIANHFLEHSEDPIGTIKNFIRVLVPGGRIYMAVPNKEMTFDINRNLTSMEHLLDDHKFGAIQSRKSHYEEWVSLVEPHFQRIYKGDEITKRVKDLMDQSYSIHFHVWTEATFMEFMNHLIIKERFPLKILESINSNEEFIYILEKDENK